MATPIPVTPAAPAPHVSWLHKLGQVVAKILGVAQKVETAALPVAETLFPQFAPEIAAADGIFSKAVAMVVNAEGTFAAVDQASNGPAKLNAVLSGIGPEIDAWIAANFPGAKALSQNVKAGYINAVVSMVNEIDGGTVPANPPASTVAAASAAVAAVAAAKAS